MINVNFYDGLSKEKVMILREQMQRFESFEGAPRKSVSYEDELVLPEGTLIHGTRFDRGVLSNIAKTGIITGQFFGIPEDGETYFCADFHRVSSSMTLNSYNKWFPYRDGRCPFGMRGKNTIAFTLFPDERLKEMAGYDCYREGTEQSLVAQSFVNMKGLPVDEKALCSSILFGVPSCFINGIVLGDNLINAENVEFLIEIFPNVFVTRNNGKLLYKVGDTKEVWHLRVESAVNEIKYEEQLKNLERKAGELDTQRKQEDALWQAIASLPVEHIAQVYKSLGWQVAEGEYLRLATALKEKYQESNSPKMN